jgi:hypothetical protein
MKKLVILLVYLAACLSPPRLFAQSDITASLTTQGTSTSYTATSGACINVTATTGGVGIDLDGTWSGTMSFYIGINTNPLKAVSATPSGGGSGATTATGNGAWQIATSGYTKVCAIFTTASSGTVLVTLHPGQPSAGGGGSGGGGSIGTCGLADALAYYSSGNALTCDTGITTNAAGQLTASGGLVAGGASNGELSLNGSTSGSFTITAPAVAGTITNPALFSNSITLGGGALNLSGSSSGTSSITAPATAGTSTNGITFSNVLYAPIGSASAPAYATTGSNNSGMYGDNSGVVYLASNGTQALRCINVPPLYCGMVAGSTFYWGPNSSAQLGLSEDSNAATLDIGNGSAANTTAKVQAAGYQSKGTTFTASGCSNTTLVGGASAGSYDSGTTGTCTVTITMGNSLTAANGWVCHVWDITTNTDAQKETAYTTTTVTFSGTTVSGDVIAFGCIGF